MPGSCLAGCIPVVGMFYSTITNGSRVYLGCTIVCHKHRIKFASLSSSNLAGLMRPVYLCPIALLPDGNDGKMFIPGSLQVSANRFVLQSQLLFPYLFFSTRSRWLSLPAPDSFNYDHALPLSTGALPFFRHALFLGVAPILHLPLSDC